MNEAERFFDCAFTERFTRVELSVLDEKAALYAAEPGYREALYELARLPGGAKAVGPLLRSTAMALFRPDAIALSKVDAALDYFGRLGIHPVHAVQVRVGRLAVREIWRYQLTGASGARIRLLDHVLQAGPAILGFFTADTDTPRLPCTVLMADAKGPADVFDRQGWELRPHLHSPNRIEVYVHVGDEPADVLRDGGILLGPAEFAQAISCQHTAGAATTIRGWARDLAVAGPELEPGVVAADPVLSVALAGYGARVRADRWQLIRAAAATCAMAIGTAGSQISDSGICDWWKSAGLLDNRESYFRARTGWTAPGRLADPMP